MAFTDEDRERMARMEITLSNVTGVMFSDTGSARCARNIEKIDHLEKQQDKSAKWVKGLVIACSGSAFVFALTVIYNLVRAAAATP